MKFIEAVRFMTSSLARGILTYVFRKVSLIHTDTVAQFVHGIFEVSFRSERRQFLQDVHKLLP